MDRPSDIKNTKPDNMVPTPSVVTMEGMRIVTNKPPFKSPTANPHKGPTIKAQNPS
ncbi:hypothetical protein VIBNIPon4_220064 [Vibrio nigripulchritudo POn4]|nr:hypothetical protein VIBNIPon4_220064 [Vibrio nigripulchritudo POn4]